MASHHIVRDIDVLREIYGAPHEAAMVKQTETLHPIYQEFIRVAPFAVLATAGRDALDASPRGDGPGFITIEDDRTLLIPDRRGNNRIDSLRNIIADPRIALLFLIPGINETFRVNGTAEISIDPALLARFPADDKLPRSVIVVHVTAVFFQCAKALMRSGLWRPERHVDRGDLPSNGTILSVLSQAKIDAEAFDAAAPARLVATLY